MGRSPLSDATQLTIDIGYIAVAVGGIGQPGAAEASVGTLALRDEGSPGPVDLFAVPLIAARGKFCARVVPANATITNRTVNNRTHMFGTNNTRVLRQRVGLPE